MSSCGWFHFDDDGSYVGDVRGDETAHGFGVAIGSGGKGEFAGSWSNGFEESGKFTSSSGQHVYEGQWSEGKRNGLGVESRTGWIYRGEWTNGMKGRYGVKQYSLSSTKYEGTWANGLQEGYGIETYADGGTYQGQWLRGLRHGYGIRQSATYESALQSRKALRSCSAGSQSSSVESHPTAIGSASSELDSVLLKRDRKIRGGGGFVLTADVAVDGSRRKWKLLLDRLGRPGLPRTVIQDRGRIARWSSADNKVKEKRLGEEARHSAGYFAETSTRQDLGDLEMDSRSSQVEDDDGSLCDQGQVLEDGLVEKYLGEWRIDKRCGYGVCHRSDGLQYEGEWLDDKKSGYGRTTLPDGSRIEGKYRNNILVSSVPSGGRAIKLFSGATEEKVQSAVRESQLAADNAKQKLEIAFIRMRTAQAKAGESEEAAKEAKRNEERSRFRASEKTEKDAQRGNNLKMHRIDEDEFLMEHDVINSCASTATKQPTSLKFQSLFNAPLRSHEHSFAGESGPKKIVSSKRFSLPWRKPKHRRAQVDRRIVEPAMIEGVTPSHSADRFHLQQPFILDGAREPRTGTNEHLQNLRNDPAGGASEHRFETRVVAQLVVPATAGFVAGGRLTAEKIRRELSEAADPRDAMHPRRNSLPSIIKEKIFESSSHAPPFTPTPPSSISTPARPEMKRSESLKPIAPSPTRRCSHTETYLVNRGVRKRVKYLYEDVKKVQRSPDARKKVKNPSFRSPGGADMSAMGRLIMSTMVTGFALSQTTPLRDWTSDSKDFKKMYALESPSLCRRRKNAGSTSDVSAIKPSEMLSREEVYVMSQRKRLEIIQRRAEMDERRKGGEIVISFSALKDWRVVLVLVFLLVNVVLVVIVYDLMKT